MAELAPAIAEIIALEHGDAHGMRRNSRTTKLIPPCRRTGGAPIITDPNFHVSQLQTGQSAGRR